MENFIFCAVVSLNRINALSFYQKIQLEVKYT